MGAVLGTLMGGVTMGITTSAINCICFACPWGSSAVAKYLHIALLLTTILTASAWHAHANAPLLFPNYTAQVECDVKESARYFGAWAIILGLCIYHILQALLLISVTRSDDKRSIIQNGGWPIKVFVLIACCVCAFFIPPVVYMYLFYIALASTLLFLALQSVYLVDLAYRGAELLVEKYEVSEGAIWKYLLFGITGLLYFIALSISAFIMYSHQDLLLIAILNVVIMIVISICSVLEVVQEGNPQAGIFQAAFVSSYNTFLLVLSTIYEPTIGNQMWKGAIRISAHFLFAVGLIYYATTVGASREETSSHERIEKGEAGSIEDPELEYSMSLFHVYLMLGALYALMMIIGWRKVEKLPSPTSIGQTLKVGNASYLMSSWTPIISSWLLSGLYLWSLFAPLILPDRDFA